MNIFFKQFVKVLSVGVVASLLVQPLTSLAVENNTSTSTDKTDQDGGGFCQMLENKTATGTRFNKPVFNASSTTSSVKWLEKFDKSKKDQERDSRRDEKGKGLQNLKGKRIDNIEDRWEAKATTTQQIQAVSNFKEEIEQALSDRQSAMKKLIGIFRAGMSSTTAEKKALNEQLLAERQIEIKAAIDKAIADCAAGVDSKTVKANWQASMKKIQDSFKTERKVGGKNIYQERKSLIGDRKVSMRFAINSFKIALQDAKAKLKSLFGLK